MKLEMEEHAAIYYSSHWTESLYEKMRHVNLCVEFQRHCLSFFCADFPFGVYTG
jgi:hypothetical protein